MAKKRRDRRDRAERCSDILNLYNAAYQALNPKAKFLHCANGPCHKAVLPKAGVLSFFCSERCRDLFWREHTFDDPELGP